MSNPLVSVVIIAHNSEECITKAISSAYAALGDIPGEVIFVDDASQDFTVQAAERAFAELGAGASNIRYQIVLAVENLGPSGARNRGVEASSGDYVMFLDSDDELLPGAVATLIQHANGSEMDVVSGSHVAAVSGGKRFSRPDAAKGSMSGVEALIALLEERVWNYNHGRLYKRSLLQEVQHDESVRRYEDLIFNAAVFSRANLVNFVAVDVYLYRIHGMSATWSQAITPEFVQNTAARVRAGIAPEAAAAVREQTWAVMEFTLAIVNFGTALLADGKNDNLPVLRSLVRSRILRRSFFYVLRRVPVLALSGMFAVVSPRVYKKFYSAYVKRSYGL